MSIMVTEVYDAFREAGASEEKSRNAAEAVAAYDSVLGTMKADMAAIRGDLTLLKWMVGFGFALLSTMGAIILRLLLAH